jgi:hypothetical protein
VLGYIAITVDEIRAQRPIGTLPTSLTNNFPSSSAASRSPTLFLSFFLGGSGGGGGGFASNPLACGAFGFSIFILF